MDADYIIIGADSAGCVLAKRLSEAGHSAPILEARWRLSGAYARDGRTCQATAPCEVIPTPTRPPL